MSMRPIIPVKPTTKWDILEQRLAEAQETVRKMKREMAWMKRVKFGHPCGHCGEILETEADFAKHFIIPDLRYLNLGDCPKEGKGWAKD